MRVKRAHFQERLGPPQPAAVVEREVPVVDPEQRAVLATIQGLLNTIASTPPPPQVQHVPSDEILTRLARLERMVNAMTDRPGIAYSFDIERGADGKITRVTAKPKPEMSGTIYKG